MPFPEVFFILLTLCPVNHADLELNLLTFKYYRKEKV